MDKEGRSASLLPGTLESGRNGEFDEAVLMSSNEEFLAGRDTEFVEDTGQVMAYANTGDAEAIGNIRIGKALPDQSDDLICLRLA